MMIKPISFTASPVGQVGAVQSERRYLSEATMKPITNPTHQPEEVAKPAAPTA